MLKAPFIVLLLISALLGSVFVFSHQIRRISQPVPSPGSSSGKFCGGIANIACPPGFTCKLAGNYPNAGGTCISLSPTIYLKATPSPVSTCIPRPPCLDAKPRCLIPETADMCPPSTTPTPVLNCPPNGWIDCMPGPGPAKPECLPDNLQRLREQCSNFQGVAY